MVNQIDFSYIKNTFLSIPDYDKEIETIKLNIVNIVYLYEKTNNYEDSIKNIKKIETEIKDNKKINKIITTCVSIFTILSSLFMYYGINYIDYEKYKDYYYFRMVINFGFLAAFSSGIYFLLSKDKKNDIYLKLFNNLENLKEIINNIEDK